MPYLVPDDEVYRFKAEWRGWPGANFTIRYVTLGLLVGQTVVYTLIFALLLIGGPLILAAPVIGGLAAAVATRAMVPAIDSERTVSHWLTVLRQEMRTPRGDEPVLRTQTTPCWQRVRHPDGKRL